MSLVFGRYMAHFKQTKRRGEMMDNLKDIYDSINDLDELDQYISGLHKANESLRAELIEADSQNDSLRQANNMLREALEMKTDNTSSMVYGFLLGSILGTVVSIFASKIPLGE